MWREGVLGGPYSPFLAPLAPGTHTVCVVLTELGRTLRPISQPVEIEILGQQIDLAPDPIDNPNTNLIGQWIAEPRPGKQFFEMVPVRHTLANNGNYTRETPGESTERGEWRLEGGRHGGKLILLIGGRKIVNPIQWGGPDTIRIASKDWKSRWNLERIDPLSGKVIRWGKSIGGIKVRLKPEKVRWLAGETPACRVMVY